MRSLFLYLFVFSLLINIFQYVNSSKILNAKEKEVQKVHSQLQQSRDSVTIASQNDYFDLFKDEDAQEYFYKRNLDYTKVIAKVNEDLITLNTTKGGNPLVPYDAMEGKVFLINKAKALNHRWIVAEYSNGDFWGQILVKYFHNEDKPTEFETVETVLYERSKI